MTDNAIVSTLADQYSRTWGILREAITRFPEEQWRAGDIEMLVPARHAIHIVETADFYTDTLSPEAFPWGKRLQCDWENTPAAQLPSRTEVLSYLDEIQSRVENWLCGLRDDDVLVPETLFPWVGANLLARIIYLLRHNQHHLAVMNTILTERGLLRVEWR